MAKVHYRPNGNTYGIEIHTDTVTRYRVCRRFDSAFCRRFGIAVLTCRRYDLLLF